jgi:hypothetical protein
MPPMLHSATAFHCNQQPQMRAQTSPGLLIEKQLIRKEMATIKLLPENASPRALS